MTYSDNNPERRNLTILSLAIIIFYLGEGYLLKSEISFTLVNIGFHNQAFLVTFVWIMLFWFLFRYAVTNRHTQGRGLENIAFVVNMDYTPVRRYLEIHAKPKYNEVHLRINPCKIYSDANSSWHIQTEGGAYVQLVGLDGYLIIQLYLCKLLFKHRATTDYYTP